MMRAKEEIIEWLNSLDKITPEVKIQLLVEFMFDAKDLVKRFTDRDEESAAAVLQDMNNRWNSVASVVSDIRHDGFIDLMTPAAEILCKLE